MKLKRELIAIFLGAVISTILIGQARVSAAFDGQELSDVTRDITVLVNSSGGNNGSGVIISKRDDVYYVLTANHVTRQQENKNGKIEYQVVTHDKESYSVNYESVQPLPNNLDLAIFEFTSDREYPVATISSVPLVEATPVFVSGWQRPGSVGGEETIRQLTSSRITTVLSEPYEGGYQIGYDNTTLGGMSGGPVVDVQGRLVGIHGLADSDKPETVDLDSSNANGKTLGELLKTGFNYGIPIDTFLAQAGQAGIYLDLEVENSPPEELTEDPVIAIDPEKDRIDNLNVVLDDVDRSLDTVERGTDALDRGRDILGF